MAFTAFASLLLYLASTNAHPFSTHRRHQHAKRAVEPKVSGTPQVLGVASDPTWNRDSCTSVHVRGRELWTCRDSQSSTAFLSSTASWTNFTSDGTPAVSNNVLTMYGDNPTSAAYFPIPDDECGPNSGGACNDGTRYAIWPNTRPMPVDTGSDVKMSLYTWINNAHITSTLATLNPHPPATLYRADFAPGAAVDHLPPATVVDEEFWPAGSILYGNYGFVIHEGTAYLYGEMNNTGSGVGIALAKVPLGSIEDKSAYSYYTGSGWSDTAPSLYDASAAIANAGTGGQGTYYYSSYFSSFVWIGASYYGCNAAFMMATAPSAEGPWTEPTQIYNGEVGSASCGAYSQQAHPGLSEMYGSGKDIYLTYTKVDDKYSTQLIRVEWK